MTDMMVCENCHKSRLKKHYVIGEIGREKNCYYFQSDHFDIVTNNHKYKHSFPPE
jgi:hypothetical protein